MQRMWLIICVVVGCGCLPRGHGHIPGPAVIRQTLTETPVIPITAPRDSEATVPKVEAAPETKPDDPLVLPAPRRDAAGVMLQINGELQDAFFDYDRAELRNHALAALKQDAGLLIPILGEFPELTIIVEGHCDERGSAEYNLGLGDHRSARAAEILRTFGVPAEKIQKVSYGKERPQCTEPVESCRQRNRRAHLLLR